ncbi:class I SAM-dependent methyltransferase [Alphaproteobacteria bacterium]|nr:class I SAM-dependent methyltransferase [Alphaproteobacteria bacterium]
MKKIRLNLFELKPIPNLLLVYKFFLDASQKWFDESGAPIKEKFESVVCPLCGSDQSTQIFEIDGFCYDECSRCNSLFANPALFPNYVEELYTDGTYDLYQEKLVRNSEVIRRDTLDIRKVSQVEQLMEQKDSRSILDVGCGSGSFLAVCSERGWDVTGVDPSGVARDVASSRYKIDVIEADFLEANFSRHFDVVTFWGVLEHLTNPCEAIVKAHRLLNKNGLLVFEVPSADCFLKSYLKKYNFSPTRYIESARHNIFFSIKFIEEFSKKNGFKLEYYETNGLDMQTILMEEFSEVTTEKILNIQDILNDQCLGDHYRIFLRKVM